MKQTFRVFDAFVLVACYPLFCLYTAVIQQLPGSVRVQAADGVAPRANSLNHATTQIDPSAAAPDTDAATVGGILPGSAPL
jgi:hypothetical protein